MLMATTEEDYFPVFIRIKITFWKGTNAWITTGISWRSLSLSHTHTPSHSIYLSHTHTHTHNLFLSHTHLHTSTHIYTHTLSLSHTHTTSITNNRQKIKRLPLAADLWGSFCTRPGANSIVDKNDDKFFLSDDLRFLSGN